MAEKLIQINDLMSICGYGYCYEGQCSINNGYNCSHPDCEDTEDNEKGESIGKCYTWSCPIGCTAYLDDLKRLDKHLYEEYKDSASSDGDIESDWMLFDEDETVKNDNELS